MSQIPRKPKKEPVYDPENPRFWDARDLETEVRRTFQICHECRMCVSFCGSFPALFDAVDREIDSGRAEGAERINDQDIKQVNDYCWQCKLCYIKCPYTVDDDAYEVLDFPRLMTRVKAVSAKRDGIKLVDQVLGEPQLVGKMGAGPMAPVSNLITKNQLLRKVSEKITGVSSKFNLPELATEPFEKWLDRHEPLPTAGEAGKVVLFATCYGDYNYPSVARAAVRVLEHNGFEVVRPDQTCCGMPNLDGGDLDGFQAKAERNVASLHPYVKEGLTVVTPGPTCGYTIKKEWPEYARSKEASEVAAATQDLMQFIEGLRRKKKLNKEFSKSLGKVAYHAACHLRAQKVGTPAVRVMRKVPDTQVQVIDECSAVDGTWGMKADYYEMGRKYAKRLVNDVNESEAQTVVSDCTLAGLRITQEAGPEVLHPVEAMAQAYGLDYS